MKIGFQGLEGYAYGALQPSAILKFEVRNPPDASLEAALSQMLKHLSIDRIDIPVFEKDKTAGRFPAITQIVRFIDALNTHCGDQRFTPIKIQKTGSQIAYIVPTLSNALVKSNLQSLVQFIRAHHQSLTSSIMDNFLDQRKKSCQQFLSSGTNAGNFIAAAAKHKVPFKILSPRHLIFSYGSQSTIFNSSITEHESAIGVSLAKSKVNTNRLLKMSGFPAPDQARVQNIEQAVKFASEIGYPVVLKPEHEEQGRGIRANIQDYNELQTCFEDVSKTYKALLIEKHIPGDHYRIDFMGEQLIKAVRRRPASVIGDGKTSITDLVKKINSEPARLDPNSSSKSVTFDDDLQTTLAKQKLSLDSIPMQRTRVFLKSISNLSRGGSQEDFKDSLNFENYKLCRSIAKTMRLDVVGVDLISQDASRPWYENNAAICEVNAQPQLGVSGTEVYWQFLSRVLLKYPHIELSIKQDAHRNPPPIFNKELDKIEIQLSPQDIFQNGCPTQYFSSLEDRKSVV